MVVECKEQACKVVESYFEEIIKGYLVSDINTLLVDELDDKKMGGCSSPLAMTVFSAMNQLGYLTNKKETKECNVIGEKATETCIKAFCDDWMSKVDDLYKKSTIQEMFVNLFRHGMAHQFLSIYSTGITRNPQQKELIYTFEIDGSQKIRVLQVKILAINFLEALKYLEEKIIKALENDHKFIRQFHRRLYSQKERYLKKNNSLFKKADRNPIIQKSNDLYATSTTTVSGVKTTQTIDVSLLDHSDENG